MFINMYEIILHLLKINKLFLALIAMPQKLQTNREAIPKIFV